MDELWDIHDYSDGHFVKNVDSGYLCRFTPHCVTIIYIRLYVGFVKCNIGLMREICSNSSKKCNVSTNFPGCLIDMFFSYKMFVNFDTQKISESTLFKRLLS